MKTWSFILDKSSLNKSVVLLIVVDNQGSSPGRKGFRMVVSEDGHLFGSIGGGVMEQEMVEEARKMIRDRDEKIRIKIKEHNNEELSGGKNLKSGSQTLAIIPIVTGLQSEIKLIHRESLLSNTGLIRYSNNGIRLIVGADQEEKYQNKIISTEEWEFTERIGSSDKLYIFGAGHVSLALSQVCSHLDFHIELFDNRKDLNTFNANSFANNKQIIDYNDISSLIKEGKNSFVVIMSHTHAGDEAILEKLIEKPLRYIGMMASKKKTQKIKANLIAKGLTEEHFSKVHVPIGIPINSQTPEEIAISIAAEMIRVKNSL